MAIHLLPAFIFGTLGSTTGAFRGVILWDHGRLGAQDQGSLQADQHVV
jgi:hypothetical protein